MRGVVKKFKNFQLYSLNFAQISVHKLSKCLKISVLKPYFHQKKISSLGPTHFEARSALSIPIKKS